MKTTLFTPTLMFGLATLATGAWAQEAAAPAPAATPTPDVSVLPAAPRNPPRARGDAAREDRGLRFNFRGAPLETVLNYMSEAAGFVIVLETPVRGTVDMWSSQPVSREEAVQLLNLALNKNGYSASVQGRNLIVASKDDAKKRNIPIRTGNDPAEIPNNAEMVMQIIPLRTINAAQAARDLATLLPASATVTANEDSNALVVTDTQINVRHIVQLLAALDSSVDSVSTMRVFQLKNADPVEMAQLLTNLFQGPTSGTAARPGQAASSTANRSAGGRGTQGGNRDSRRSTRPDAGSSGSRGSPVVAIPDPRTYSIIVTASKEAMPEIADMVAQLDASTAHKQKVFVYTLENADVRQVEGVLKNLFQSSNARTTTSNQPDPLTTRASSNSQTQSNSSGLSIGSGARGNR